MADNLLTPTPEEHAYHQGWEDYFDGVKQNPYNRDDEQDLFENYEEGYRTAEQGDDSDEVDELLSVLHVPEESD